MGIYFESLEQFHASGGLKQTTITARQLLPAIVAHMQRMDRQFTLHVNGRLPTSIEALLDEAFALCHLQQPFYTQHCASRNMRYKLVSKNRLKIDFTLRYRMTREEEKWVIAQISAILVRITKPHMSDIEKIIAVHDYIIRAYDYEMNTTGSPFTVYTFMHEKQGVCMAYALLFQKMMEQVGIQCYYVVGKADGESDLGHAWNMVQLDGQWYHIDATWNDVGKRLRNHAIHYRYFLRSDEVFKRDHSWNFAHYPPCTSERYAAMQSIYDAAVHGTFLYYPKKQTAQLMRMNVTTLQSEIFLPIRVQQCVVYDGQLYFRHVDERALYTLDVQKKALTCIVQKEVAHISTTDRGIAVQFTDGEQLRYEERVEEQVEVQIEADVTVPLERFGDSWFGAYKGASATIAFSVDDVKIVVPQPVKQLSIDVMRLHNALHITLQVGKKSLAVTEPLHITMPDPYDEVYVNGTLLA